MAAFLPSLLVLLVTFSITIPSGFSLANERGEFITWGDLQIQNYSTANTGIDQDGSQIIVVSKVGFADSRTVQGAIDLVPPGNSQRVKILIYPGIYNEKVTIPATKPYISLIGTRSGTTTITWNTRASDLDSAGNPIGTYNSATFAVEADYFCATEITFENSAPAAVPGAEGEQAVALKLSGDKAMLYRCRFIGTQDTLLDDQGRHYFYQCWVQGSIHFIFGNATSLYERCLLKSVAKTYGAVAASHRDSPTQKSGFSFLKSHLTGSGSLDLGRAWGPYARVVYSFSQIDNIISPDGWSDMNNATNQNTAYFAVYRCSGRGAEVGSRTRWAKSLTDEEAKPFLGRRFIDGHQWLMLRDRT